jgi:hypothetical protein
VKIGQGWGTAERFFGGIKSTIDVYVVRAIIDFVLSQQDFFMASPALKEAAIQGPNEIDLLQSRQRGVVSHVLDVLARRGESEVESQAFLDMTSRVVTVQEEIPTHEQPLEIPILVVLGPGVQKGDVKKIGVIRQAGRASSYTEFRARLASYRLQVNHGEIIAGFVPIDRDPHRRDRIHLSGPVDGFVSDFRQLDTSDEQAPIFHLGIYISKHLRPALFSIPINQRELTAFSGKGGWLVTSREIQEKRIALANKRDPFVNLEQEEAREAGGKYEKDPETFFRGMWKKFGGPAPVESTSSIRAVRGEQVDQYVSVDVKGSSVAASVRLFRTTTKSYSGSGMSFSEGPKHPKHAVTTDRLEVTLKDLDFWKLQDRIFHVRTNMSQPVTVVLSMTRLDSGKFDYQATYEYTPNGGRLEYVDLGVAPADIASLMGLLKVKPFGSNGR